MTGEMSMPVTSQPAATSCRAVGMPVPHPTSSTRAPLGSWFNNCSTAVTWPSCVGTARRSGNYGVEPAGLLLLTLCPVLGQRHRFGHSCSFSIPLSSPSQSPQGCRASELAWQLPIVG